MKKTDFLTKLRKQKKLQMVDPSEEICQAYLEKSDKSMNSSKVTFEIESYEDSIALAYYSMYYSVLALLFRIGVKCENHTATIILLKKVFNIDNESLFKAKKERVDKQYYVDFSVTKNEVQEMIIKTEQLNSKILEFINNLNQDGIRRYRKNAESLIKNTEPKN